jgi:hypothetical protein
LPLFALKLLSASEAVAVARRPNKSVRLCVRPRAWRADSGALQIAKVDRTLTNKVAF